MRISGYRRVLQQNILHC